MAQTQVPLVAAILVLTILLGVLAYYVVEPLDPLGLFQKDGDPAAPLAPGEVQEAAIEALVSVLDGKDQVRGRGGGVMYQKRGGRVDGQEERDSMLAAVQKEMDRASPNVYDTLMLGDLRKEREKRQIRARQHARETVAAVVEEMTYARKKDQDQAKRGG